MLESLGAGREGVDIRIVFMGKKPHEFSPKFPGLISFRDMLREFIAQLDILDP
jgi:hypothetical protein